MLCENERERNYKTFTFVIRDVYQMIKNKITEFTVLLFCASYASGTNF